MVATHQFNGCLAGRDFTETQRLHDGPALPHLSSLTLDEKFQRTAALRERAKKKHKELQDFEKLSKAHNMKTTAARVFNLVIWCSTSDITLLQLLRAGATPNWIFHDAVWLVGLDLPAYFGLRQR